MNTTKKAFLRVLPIVLVLMMVISTNVFAFENFDTNLLQNLQTGTDNIESANTAVGKIWNTIILILQVLAVAAVIMAGVRYMFASADGKADIKKQTVGLVVGAVLVFGASMVIDFVVNVTKEITGTTENVVGTNNTQNVYETPTSLKIGETKKLTLTTQSENSTNTSVIYSSSDTSVATVDSNGIVTAVGEGQANIYAKVSDSDKVSISKVTVTINEIPVEEINLSEKEITIKVGETRKVTTTIKPESVTNKNVIYSSSNTGVATVDSDGVITAVGVGQTDIYAKIADTDKVAISKVTVTINEIPVEEINLSEKEITIKAGETKKVTPMIKPENATNVNLVYSSDNTKVATVDSNGVITAVGVGQTDIYAKIADTDKVAISKVTVITNEIPVEEINFNEKEITIKAGETRKVTTTIKPENATNVNLVYSSDNTKVATVDSNGVITAVGAGQTKIYAKLSNSDKVAISTVTVTTKEIPVKNIKLQSSLKMKEGENVKLTPVIEPENATNVNLEYSSSNTKVATVDTNGNVVALSKGTTKITVASGKIKETIKINVESKEIPVKDIKLQSSLKMKEGENVKLTPVIEPENATNVNLEYSSSNTKVATVDTNGNVTALSKGTTKITVASGKVKETIKINVESREIPVEEININQREISIKVGETHEIGATIKPSNATNKNLSYLSGNANVVDVTDDGKIIGKNAGTATVTIKSESGNVSTELYIKVEESHKIHFINTSVSSDCILLESNGKYALIDTGRYSDYNTVKNYLTNLNVTKLEYMILTHNHKDHVGAAAKLIKKYKPNKLYLKRYHGNDTNGADGPYDLEAVEKNRNRYNDYIKAAKTAKTEIVYIDDYNDGYTITLNKMVIKNYNTKNLLTDDAEDAKKMSENGNAFTSLVIVNGLKTYLASDLTEDRYADPIAKMIGKVDVHKLGHHGLNNGTSKAEANVLKPDYAIITNTEANLATYKNSINKVKKYTKEEKVYYSGDNAIIVDYTSGIVKVTEVK